MTRNQGGKASNGGGILGPKGDAFAMNSLTSAAVVAVKLKKKAKRQKNAKAEKRQQMWKDMMRSRRHKQKRGEVFDMQDWLHRHLVEGTPKKKKRKKRKASLPPLPDPVLDPPSMTPWDVRDGSAS